MDRKFAEIGAKLRHFNITSIIISYGSGGYCVVLKDKTDRQFAGYSWDLDKSFEIALSRFKVGNARFDDEVITKSDNRIPERKIP